MQNVRKGNCWDVSEAEENRVLLLTNFFEFSIDVMMILGVVYQSFFEKKNSLNLIKSGQLGFVDLLLDGERRSNGSLLNDFRKTKAV